MTTAAAEPDGTAVRVLPGPGRRARPPASTSPLPTAVPLAALLPGDRRPTPSRTGRPAGVGAEPAGRRPARPGGRAGRRRRSGRASCCCCTRRTTASASRSTTTWSRCSARPPPSPAGRRATPGRPARCSARWPCSARSGPACATGTPLAGVLLGVLALLLLGGGAAMSHGRRRRAGRHPAGRARRDRRRRGRRVVLLGPPFGAAHLVLAAAVVVLVAATGARRWSTAATRSSWRSAWRAARPARRAAGAARAGPRRPAPRRWSRPLALALTTAMPTLALRLSRIPRPAAAAHRRRPGRGARAAGARAGASSGCAGPAPLLSGLLVGCYAAAALAARCWPPTPAAAWPAVLAAVLGVLLLLRARLFRQRAQVAAPLRRGRGGVRRRDGTRSPRPRPERTRCCSAWPRRSRWCWPRWPAAFGRWGGRAAAQPAAGARRWTCWRRCCCWPWCRSCWPCGTSTRCCWSCGHEADRCARWRWSLALCGAHGADRPARAWAACSQPVRPGAHAARRGCGQDPLIDRLGLRRVWELSTGRGVTVAVVDSGVDARHPKLAGAVEPPVDFRALVHQRGRVRGRARARATTARTTARRSPGSSRAVRPTTSGCWGSHRTRGSPRCASTAPWPRRPPR